MTKTQNTAAQNTALEKRCMIISMAGLSVVSVVGFVLGVMSDSITIIIQSFLYLIDIVLSYMTLVFLKKIYFPPDEKYNFGYQKLEPFLINTQGALMIAGGAIGIMFAIQDIVHHDNAQNYFLIFISTCAFICVNYLVWSYVNRQYKKTGSSFLKASVVQWICNLYESIGVIVGFVIAYVMLHSDIAPLVAIAPYVDPVMAIILSVLILKTPAQLYVESLVDLLDMNPDREMSARIQASAQHVLHERFHVPSSVHIKLRKAGRVLFLVLSFDIARERSAADVSAITHSLTQEIRRAFPSIYLVNFNVGIAEERTASNIG